MRLAILTLLAASTAQAAVVHLPTPPGPNAVAEIRFGSQGLPAIPISIPPSYPLDKNPLFGSGGDATDDYAVVGAPETGGVGAAFVYSTDDGAYLRQLIPGGLIQGGTNGPQFGYDVLEYKGLILVSAPNAGGPALTQNPGFVYVFDPATGQKLQTIAGIGTYWGLGQDLLELNGLPYASRVSKTTGAVQNVLLSVINVPEPGGVWLAALGLLAARRRRCR